MAPLHPSSVSKTALRQDELRRLCTEWTTPGQLIDGCSRHPLIGPILDQSTGVPEVKTLREHYRCIATQLTQYPFMEHLPRRRGEFPLSKERLTQLILIHDADKVGSDMSKEAQHQRSIARLEKASDMFELTPRELKLMKSLISFDHLGMFFKNVIPPRPTMQFKADFFEKIKHLDESGRINACQQEFDRWEQWIQTQDKTTAENKKTCVCTVVAEIEREAKKLDLSPRDYLRLLTIYYQVDCSSYSYDAGAAPSMEFLFERRVPTPTALRPMLVFDKQQGRLTFASLFEPYYQQVVTMCAALSTPSAE